MLRKVKLFKRNRVLNKRNKSKNQAIVLRKMSRSLLN